MCEVSEPRFFASCGLSSKLLRQRILSCPCCRSTYSFRAVHERPLVTFWNPYLSIFIAMACSTDNKSEAKNTVTSTLLYIRYSILTNFFSAF